MNRETTIALNKRLLENFNSNCTDQSDREIRVQAEVFFCSDLLGAEKDILFRNTPQPIAFSAEIPEQGAYLSLDVLDVPVLLTRDYAGELHAFINACAHRGAPVAQGSGQGRRLVCPFHGWSYSHAGELVGRPQESCFDTAKIESGLTALPVAERSGIVIVGLNTEIQQRDVDTALGSLEEEIANFHLEQYTCIDRKNLDVNANWKLVNDLSLESYGSGAQMIRAEPVATLESSRVVYVGLAGKNCSFEEASEAYRFGGGVFEKEDLPMAELCQRGLEAARQDLIIGKNEPLLQFWHRLWGDAVR